MIERADIPSVLTILLLTGMIVFALLRRMRQPITWGFAGVMIGVAIFYLADMMLYRPGISAQAGLVWQFIGFEAAKLAVLAALALNYLLRDGRLQKWEWAMIGLIVARNVIDSIWLVGRLQPDVSHPCLTPQGPPQLTCSPADQAAIASGAAAVILMAILFINTAFNAPDVKRHVLHRYMLWVALFAVGGGLGLHILALAGRKDLGIVPSQPPALLALLVGMRMLLALEEAETGVHFSIPGWRPLVFIILLIVAGMVDLTWGWFAAPIWTLGVLAAGIAGAGAFLMKSLTHRAPTAHEDIQNAPPAPEQTHSANAETPRTLPPMGGPLRIYLFGLMRVVRNGEILSNSTDIWRSAKTRSLLAYLALRGKSGANQTEIVNVLWPPKAELDGTAEQRSLTAFRSYLSTLRRVLEPDGPRGSQRYVQQAGARYFLRRNSEIWVDVWQFDDLVAQAERHWVAGQQEAAVACWEEALALYAPEGLLVDDEHLESTALEATRERLRQTWLLGLRRLAKVYTGQGQPERTAELRRTWRAAQRLGQEK